MKPTARRRVLNALHPSRMEPYLHATDGDEKLALTLYIWHTDLTAAIQQMLGITEVVLRNEMDAQVQKWNRSQGGSSWLLEEPAAPLHSLSAGKRKDALHRATRQAVLRDTEHRRYGAAVRHDDVLAQMMFGLWKDLLPNHAPDASPDAQANLNRARLWEEGLRFAFPHEDDPEGSITYWRVARTHLLRNRVSHMEPLLAIDVQDHMRKAFGLIRSIDPTVADWATGVSRVGEVLNRRPS